MPDTASNSASEAATSAPPAADRVAFRALVAGLLVVSACHVYYLAESGMVPSWDEAHYMIGARQIADGVRSGSARRAWNAYADAIETKPPLICLPAAAALLVFGEGGDAGVRACLMTAVPILFALGLAAYSLFRNPLSPAGAATAAFLLATFPMITGLAHRFYVENLLLLVTVVYLDILLRHPWDSTRWACLAGAALGAGLLAKATFAAAAFFPTAYLLAVALRAAETGAERRHLLARAAMMTAIGGAFALTWYPRNWRAVLEHAKWSFANCGYPTLDSIAADLSQGPHLFATTAAVAGLAALSVAWGRAGVSAQQRRAWIVLLIAAAVVAASTLSAANKAVRFSVGWLPTIAALVVFAPWALLSARRAAAVSAGMAGLSFVLFLHNSFGVLPVGPMRVGDLVVLDSRFALNIPDWYDDNHPVDRRSHVLPEVVRAIDADAAERLGPGVRYRVALTVNHLLASPEAFLLYALGSPASYALWTPADRQSLPDYIVRANGVERLYPGRMFADYYPELEEDAAAGRIPYRLMVRIPGPDGSDFAVYRRR